MRAPGHLKRRGLAGAVLAGSLVLAVVVPAGTLWVLTRVGGGPVAVYGLVLLGGTLAMSGCARAVARIDACRRCEDDYLERCVVFAVLLAIVLISAWFLAGTGDVGHSHGPFPG